VKPEDRGRERRLGGNRGKQEQDQSNKRERGEKERRGKSKKGVGG
jgi:hypothetical protein